MEAIIVQHLLSTELQSLEIELARRSASSETASGLLRMQTRAAHLQTQADCKHLEVTLQAARCEHTAADTALQNALQLLGQQLQTAQKELLLSREVVASHRASLQSRTTPASALKPSSPTRDEEPPDTAALQAVAAAFCEAMEAATADGETAPDATATPLISCPSSPIASAPPSEPTGGRDAPPPAASRPHDQEVEEAVAGGGLEAAQALSSVLAWRSLQMQIEHVADTVSCLQCAPGRVREASDGAARAELGPQQQQQQQQLVVVGGGVSAGADVISRLRRLNAAAALHGLTPGAPPPHEWRGGTHGKVAGQRGGGGGGGGSARLTPAGTPTMGAEGREELASPMAMPKAQLVFRPTPGGLRVVSEGC
eukprot:Transcript_12150.p1 GENE.Transcript_12150~~Transcript_12150.p1  ORF type:complete len:369 (-),score=87.56 Transcript_12150:60-1166(-)